MAFVRQMSRPISRDTFKRSTLTEQSQADLGIDTPQIGAPPEPGKSVPMCQRIGLGVKTLLANFAGKEVEMENIGKVAVVVGALLVAVWIAAFIASFLLGGRCNEYNVVSATTSGDFEQCDEKLLVSSTAITIDTKGRWSTDSSYRATDALYTITFNEYQNSFVNLQAGLTDMQAQLDELLDALEGNNTVEVLLGLYFSNITSAGVSGTMSLSLNLDPAFFNTAYDFHAEYRDSSLKKSLTNLIPWLTIECSKKVDNTTPYLFEKAASLHTGSRQIVLQAPGSTDGGPYASKIPTNTAGCNPDSATIFPGDYVVAYAGFGSTYTLEYDIGQVMAIHYCNTYPESCGNVLQGVDADGSIALKGSSELYPTVYLDGPGLYAFNWSTKESANNPWYSTVENQYIRPYSYFYAVPWLLPYTGCDSCDGSNTTTTTTTTTTTSTSGFSSTTSNFGSSTSTSGSGSTSGSSTSTSSGSGSTSSTGGCSAYMTVAIEYHLDSAEIATTTSSSSTSATEGGLIKFGTLTVTSYKTALWNEDLTFANLQCTMDGLRVDWSSVSEPFATSSGLYDCTIKACTTIIGRLGIAYGAASLAFEICLKICIAIFLIAGASIVFRGKDPEAHHAVAVPTGKDAAIDFGPSARDLTGGGEGIAPNV